MNWLSGVLNGADATLLVGITGFVLSTIGALIGIALKLLLDRIRDLENSDLENHVANLEKRLRHCERHLLPLAFIKRRRPRKRV